MQVTQFLHAALLVSDLGQAQHFYEHVLGLNRVDRPLKFPGVWYQIGPVQLHLMTTANPPAELVNPQKWGRNRHLAFAVADLEGMKTRLANENYSFQMSASGRAALFVQDPDGNVIELSQG